MDLFIFFPEFVFVSGPSYNNYQQRQSALLIKTRFCLNESKYKHITSSVELVNG